MEDNLVYYEGYGQVIRQWFLFFLITAVFSLSITQNLSKTSSESSPPNFSPFQLFLVRDFSIGILEVLKLLVCVACLNIFRAISHLMDNTLSIICFLYGVYCLDHIGCICLLPPKVYPIICEHYKNLLRDNPDSGLCALLDCISNISTKHLVDIVSAWSTKDMYSEADITALREQLQTSQRETSDLDILLTAAQEKLNSPNYREEVKVLENQIQFLLDKTVARSDYNADLAKLQKDHDNITQSLSTLQAQKDAADKEIEQLREDSETKYPKQVAIKDSVAQRRTRPRRTRPRPSRYEHLPTIPNPSKDYPNKDNEQAKSLVKDLKKYVAEAKHSETVLKEDDADASIKANELKSARLLHGAFVVINKNFELANKKLETEITTLDENLARLRLDPVEAAINAANKRASDAENMTKISEQHSQAIQSNITTLREQLETEKHLKEDALNVKSNCLEVVGTLQQTIDTQKFDITQLQDKKRQLAEEAGAEIKRLQQQLRDIQAQYAKLNENLVKKQHIIDNQPSINNLQQHGIDLDTITQMKTENTALSQSLEEKNEQIRRGNAQLQDLDTTVHQRNKQILTLHHQVNSYRNKIRDALFRLDEPDTDDKADNFIGNAAEDLIRLKNLQSSHDALQDANSNQCNEITKLQKRIRELEARGPAVSASVPPTSNSTSSSGANIFQNESVSTGHYSPGNTLNERDLSKDPAFSSTFTTPTGSQPTVPLTSSTAFSPDDAPSQPPPLINPTKPKPFTSIDMEAFAQSFAKSGKMNLNNRVQQTSAQRQPTLSTHIQLPNSNMATPTTNRPSNESSASVPPPQLIEKKRASKANRPPVSDMTKFMSDGHKKLIAERYSNINLSSASATSQSHPPIFQATQSPVVTPSTRPLPHNTVMSNSAGPSSNSSANPTSSDSSTVSTLVPDVIEDKDDEQNYQDSVTKYQIENRKLKVRVLQLESFAITLGEETMGLDILENSFRSKTGSRPDLLTALKCENACMKRRNTYLRNILDQNYSSIPSPEEWDPAAKVFFDEVDEFEKAHPRDLLED